MELNDLIKSNIFLIGLYVGLILLIAMIIFLIRNHARKKELDNIVIEPDELDLESDEGIVSIKKQKDNGLLIKNENSYTFTERLRGKFVVINEMQDEKDTNDFKKKHEREFKEVYETTASKLMFKFNPWSEEAIE